MMTVTPSPHNGSSAQAGRSAALMVDDLAVGYGGSDVLRGVSLTVARGGISCVVGPNGAGESTLLGAISGLLRPRTGRITLHGEELTGKSPRKILQMGVVQVPQNHSLFRDMTVRDNITLGGYILRDRRLVTQRLAAVLETFPQVTEWLGRKAGSLSGGQQRLVEFARCLMLDPSLVILDEPSMGLAPKVLRSVFAAVAMMNERGKTILLVEQNARAGLRLATHGLVLENGRVRLSGTGQEVLEHPEIGALYLGGSVSGSSLPDGMVPGGTAPGGGADADGVSRPPDGPPASPPSATWTQRPDS
jgi:ABC-type branched-subunit amino acid transport system ATPase component